MDIIRAVKIKSQMRLSKPDLKILVPGAKTANKFERKWTDKFPEQNVKMFLIKSAKMFQ